MRLPDGLKFAIKFWLAFLISFGIGSGLTLYVMTVSTPTIHAQSSPRFDSLRPIESVAGFGVLELRDTVTDSCYIVVTYGSDVTITDAQPCPE